MFQNISMLERDSIYFVTNEESKIHHSNKLSSVLSGINKTKPEKFVRVVRIVFLNLLLKEVIDVMNNFNVPG